MRAPLTRVLSIKKLRISAGLFAHGAEQFPNQLIEKLRRIGNFGEYFEDIQTKWYKLM
jgi:hypothetical protein